MKTPRLERLDDERSAMVAKWSGLIVWSMRRWPWAKEKLGDLAESIAADALVDAALMYDPERGAFSSFAIKIIWSYLQNEADRDGVVRRKSGGRYGCEPLEFVSLSKRSAKLDMVFQLAAPAPDKDAIDSDDVAALKRAIKRLDPMQRRVIRLRYFKHKSLRWIAKVVGLTAERVRQIQNKSIERLQSMMGVEKGGA